MAMQALNYKQDEITIRNLIREYKETKDSKLKTRIVKAHLFSVHKIAKNYSKRYMNQYDDLVQVGCIGLINAIDKFDLKQKVTFKTYSSHLINGEMMHYLRDYTSIIRQPRDLQELLPKINKIKQQFINTHDKEPNIHEIAEKLYINSEKVEQALKMEKYSIPISLDNEVNKQDNEGNTLLSQLEDKKYKSFQLAQEDIIILNDAINIIKDQSRQIIEYSFYHDLTQTEIAKKLGISQMQVSRRLRYAVAELWEILNTRVTPW